MSWGAVMRPMTLPDKDEKNENIVFIRITLFV